MSVYQRGQQPPKRAKKKPFLGSDPTESREWENQPQPVPIKTISTTGSGE
jgi:hypothetical protein